MAPVMVMAAGKREIVSYRSAPPWVLMAHSSRVVIGTVRASWFLGVPCAEPGPATALAASFDRAMSKSAPDGGVVATVRPGSLGRGRDGAQDDPVDVDRMRDHDVVR